MGRCDRRTWALGLAVSLPRELALRGRVSARQSSARVLCPLWSLSPPVGKTNETMPPPHSSFPKSQTIFVTRLQRAFDAVARPVAHGLSSATTGRPFATTACHLTKRDALERPPPDHAPAPPPRGGVASCPHRRPLNPSRCVVCLHPGVAPGGRGGPASPSGPFLSDVAGALHRSRHHPGAGEAGQPCGRGEYRCASPSNVASGVYGRNPVTAAQAILVPFHHRLPAPSTSGVTGRSRRPMANALGCKPVPCSARSLRAPSAPTSRP